MKPIESSDKSASQLGQGQLTAITNVRIFDGERVIDARTVVIDGGIIRAVGGPIPAGAEVIDAHGATLLPGLIDAHVHTSVNGLREALQFGITTELEMAGRFNENGRQFELATLTNIADVRSAGMGLTAPGGHPDELMPDEGIPDFMLKEIEKMSEDEKAAFFATHADLEADGLDVTTVEGAIEFTRNQLSQGADYLKVMIEEGSVLNHPGLPVLREEVLKAAVDEAHRHGKMAIAHILTAEAAQTAVNIGIDGLAHVFIDRPAEVQPLIRQIAAKKMFVTPCLVLNRSIIGKSAAEIAEDARVKPKLSREWAHTLCSCFNTFPAGNMADSFQNVMDLHRSGVDILVGTDVSFPVPYLGGLAHGVSVHHELQLLVEAGFTPTEALKAATSVTAKRFSLPDRGRIQQGARADLLLVKGDPTVTISDTLSIVEVWKEGRPVSKMPFDD